MHHSGRLVLCARKKICVDRCADAEVGFMVMFVDKLKDYLGSAGDGIECLLDADQEHER